MTEAIGIVLREDGTEGVFALPPGFSVGPAHMKVGKVTWEDSEKVGKMLSGMVDFHALSLPWLVGDFLNAMEERWPDRYTQLVGVTGWSIGTLKNYEWASRKVPVENRIWGKETVPIRFGMNVATLPLSEQREVLKRSHKEGLTAKESHRLARGMENYKAKRLPEKGNTRIDRLRSAFDRVYAFNERRIRAETLKDGCKFMWEACCDLWEGAV